MKQATALYDTALYEAVQNNATWAEVAKDVGAPTENAARIAAARRARDGSFTHIRNTALNLPPLDAVEYLLDTLETLALVSLTKPHVADKIAPTVTYYERRVLIALIDARAADGVLNKDSLYNAVYFDKPDCGARDIKSVDVFICKLRKKLKRGKIETIWGEGYRFVDDETATPDLAEVTS